MIAIVYPQFYGVGGIARYIDSFLSNLTHSGIRVYLITGDENFEYRSYKNVDIIHVPFRSTRLNLFFWGMSVKGLLEKLYQDNKIQYVNFHFPPLIPGLFLPKSIPMILTAHTTYLGMSGNFYNQRLFTGQWGKLSIAIKSWMERKIFEKASKVITLTEQGRQEVLAYGYKREIVVIPNGADTVKFLPDLNVIKDIDVIFCGRIEKRKGSRAMVEVCKRLIDKKKDINIVIVGYGDDDVFVKSNLTKFSNNITLTGKVAFSDMSSYYNRSRLYVSTSFYEGLPGTCLEAMSMCIPVVVWDLLFYRDLVINDHTGFIVPANDFDALTRKINYVLSENDLRHQIGMQARKLLEENYSWKKLSVDILKVFN